MTDMITTDNRRLLNTEDTKYLAWQAGNHAFSSAQHAKNEVTQSCFVAGTKVMTENGYIPIETINVGDMVYALPEEGCVGDKKPELKRVTKVFKHEDKELCHLTYREIDEDFEYGSGLGVINNHLLVTPNHPFYVIGACTDSGENVAASPTGFTAYEAGVWKSVDEISELEVIKNAFGEKYCVTNIRSLSAHANGKNYAWLQGSEDYAPYYWKDVDTGMLYDLDNRRVLPGFGDEEDTIINGYEIVSAEVTNEDMMLGNSPEDGYKPFKAIVYNIEVEDYHTYFVGDDAIWVHNKNSVNTLPTITKHEILVL